jgi:hypothetical protein
VTLAEAATLARKRLPAVASFRGGTAVCAPRVPARARGKRLAGSVTVEAGSTSIRRTFAIAVL